MRFILFLFVLQSFLGFSQKSVDTWIEGRAKWGFLAAHRSSLGHLPAQHAYAGEISYLMQSKGKKNWHNAYNYPVYGVTVFGGSVGNTQYLGYFFGAYGFINFPFISRKHYVLSGKLGCGLAYGTKHYDPLTNILGMAVSTPVNAQICLALESRIKFKQNSIIIGLDMTHFSNGATKVPNFGINVPYVSVGYGHRIKKAVDTSFVVKEFKKSWEFGVNTIISAKEVYPTGSRKYGVLSVNLVGRRYFRPKTAMEVSFDVMYNSANVTYHADVPKTWDELIQLGVFAGYVLPLDRFHFLLGMGVYVRDKFHPDDPVYHRVGMRYVFENGININVVLKSHWARADYVEYGIGYTFKR